MRETPFTAQPSGCRSIKACEGEEVYVCSATKMLLELLALSRVSGPFLKESQKLTSVRGWVHRVGYCGIPLLICQALWTKGLSIHCNQISSKWLLESTQRKRAKARDARCPGREGRSIWDWYEEGPRPGHLMMGSFDLKNTTKENCNPRAHEIGKHDSYLVMADTASYLSISISSTSS